MTALVLHGTSGSSQDEWFPWLKNELEKKGYQVWVPDLPGADEPDINTYNPFIINNCPFELNEETIIIGHSSGAVAALGLVQNLPNRVGKVILVAGFVDDLNYDPVKKMFRTWKFDWEKIKTKARKFIVVCSDNDPFVPAKHGRELERLLDTKSIVMPGQKHFGISTFPKYSRFPELFDLI
jgi:predicted alpha/beta hydrolase family esterase